jgi:hypothetical protein
MVGPVARTASRANSSADVASGEDEGRDVDSADERFVHRETGDGLAGVQILREHSAGAAADRHGENQSIPAADSRPVLQLERCRDIRRRDAVDTPSRVRLDDTPGLSHCEGRLELARGVHVELLQNLRAEDAGSLGPQVAQDRFATSCLRPASTSCA